MSITIVQVVAGSAIATIVVVVAVVVAVAVVGLKMWNGEPGFFYDPGNNGFGPIGGADNDVIEGAGEAFQLAPQRNRVVFVEWDGRNHQDFLL